jgi:hypothetical protein
VEGFHVQALPVSCPDPKLEIDRLAGEVGFFVGSIHPYIKVWALGDEIREAR